MDYPVTDSDLTDNRGSSKSAAASKPSPASRFISFRQSTLLVSFKGGVALHWPALSSHPAIPRRRSPQSNVYPRKMVTSRMMLFGWRFLCDTFRHDNNSCWSPKQCPSEGKGDELDILFCRRSSLWQSHLTTHSGLSSVPPFMDSLYQCKKPHPRLRLPNETSQDSYRKWHHNSTISHHPCWKSPVVPMDYII